MLKSLLFIIDSCLRVSDFHKTSYAYGLRILQVLNPFMAEFPGRLHKPLQIPQYNTTCAINYLVTIPQNIRYSFIKFIVLFMFTQH